MHIGSKDFSLKALSYLISIQEAAAACCLYKLRNKYVWKLYEKSFR